MEWGGLVVHRPQKAPFQSQEPILYASLLRSCRGFPPFPGLIFIRIANGIRLTHP